MNRGKTDMTANLGVDRVALGGEGNELATLEDKCENSTEGSLNSTSFRNELPKCTLRGSRFLDVNGSLLTRELSLQLAGLCALKTVKIPARFLPKFFFTSQI